MCSQQPTIAPNVAKSVSPKKKQQHIVQNRSAQNATAKGLSSMFLDQMRSALYVKGAELFDDRLISIYTKRNQMSNQAYS